MAIVLPLHEPLTLALLYNIFDDTLELMSKFVRVVNLPPCHLGSFKQLHLFSESLPLYRP